MKSCPAHKMPRRRAQAPPTTHSAAGAAQSDPRLGRPRSAKARRYGKHLETSVAHGHLAEARRGIPPAPWHPRDCCPPPPAVKVDGHNAWRHEPRPGPAGVHRSCRIPYTYPYTAEPWRYTQQPQQLRPPAAAWSLVPRWPSSSPVMTPMVLPRGLSPCHR